MGALFKVLAGFIASLIGKVFSKVTDRLVKNATASIIMVSAYIALVTALAGTVSLILSGISATIPADLAQGLAMFKPDNFEACIGAILSTKVALWIYHTKSKFLEWESNRKVL